MFRLSFGWEKLENIKNNLLCSFLRAQIWACMRKLVLACAALIHAYVGLFICAWLFFTLCECRFHPKYACRILRMQGLSCIRMTLGKNPNLDILAPFSFVCNFNIILHHFWTKMYVLCHISSHYASNIIFSTFASPTHEFNPILFLQVLALYSGRGPARSWCGTTSLLRRLEGISLLWVLSSLSIWCRRGLPVLSWRRPWLSGGGTLPMPSTLLAERWPSLLMTSTAWLACGLMGSWLVWRMSRAFG